MTPKPKNGGRPGNAVFTDLLCDPAWIAQAKIDGWRARWQHGTLRSRAGQRLHQCAELIAELQERAATLHIDAEITFSNGYKGDAQLWCFDLPDMAAPLEQRLQALAEICAGGQRMRLIPCDVAWQDVTANQWEGLVFKVRSSLYPRVQVTPDWIKFRA